MQTTHSDNLIRKQIMLSNENIEKLESIAKDKGLSVANVVRTAIDSFNPKEIDTGENSELMQLVSSRLKEAIEDTLETRKRLDKTLSSLESRGA